MKTIKLLILIIIISGLNVNAQVAISTDGSTADGSAMLEVKSTNKGFLPPRMTETQRDAISNPVAGLSVWCSDCGDNGEMQIYNGSSWTNMIGGAAATAPDVGDFYGGGVVFYIFQSGDPGYVEGETHGFICAISDQSTAAEWGCHDTEITGVDGTAIGTGAQNTIDIEAECNTSGTAADICANLSLNGYNDWVLPSKDELNLMYQNKATIDVTAIANGGSGFAADDYWSSSEYSNESAWQQSFITGNQIFQLKLFLMVRVRAIRTF